MDAPGESWQEWARSLGRRALNDGRGRRALIDGRRTTGALVDSRGGAPHTAVHA